MLTKREKATKKRFENVERVNQVLKLFFNNGFKSLEALTPLAQFYYPEFTDAEIKNFFHFRKLTDDMIAKMENVLEQLKKE